MISGQHSSAMIKHWNVNEYEISYKPVVATFNLYIFESFYTFHSQCKTGKETQCTDKKVSL